MTVTSQELREQAQRAREARERERRAREREHVATIRRDGGGRLRLAVGRPAGRPPVVVLEAEVGPGRVATDRRPQVVILDVDELDALERAIRICRGT